VNKSPSALFVASDGVSLRIYQALLDARSLLTATASKQYQVLLTEFTKFTEAVNDNTDGISKHSLSPYNAHFINYSFYLVSGSSTLRI